MWLCILLQLMQSLSNWGRLGRKRYGVRISQWTINAWKIWNFYHFFASVVTVELLYLTTGSTCILFCAGCGIQGGRNNSAQNEREERCGIRTNTRQTNSGKIFGRDSRKFGYSRKETVRRLLPSPNMSHLYKTFMWVAADRCGTWRNKKGRWELSKIGFSPLVVASWRYDGRNTKSYIYSSSTSRKRSTD